MKKRKKDLYTVYEVYTLLYFHSLASVFNKWKPRFKISNPKSSAFHSFSFFLPHSLRLKNQTTPFQDVPNFLWKYTFNQGRIKHLKVRCKLFFKTFNSSTGLLFKESFNVRFLKFQKNKDFDLRSICYPEPRKQCDAGEWRQQTRFTPQGRQYETHNTKCLNTMDCGL